MQLQICVTISLVSGIVPLNMSSIVKVLNTSHQLSIKFFYFLFHWIKKQNIWSFLVLKFRVGLLSASCVNEETDIETKILEDDFHVLSHLDVFLGEGLRSWFTTSAKDSDSRHAWNLFRRNIG